MFGSDCCFFVPFPSTANPPPGVRLLSADANRVLLELSGAPNTLYVGEKWILQMVLGNYPFESPSTTFTGNAVPVHHHVYSNGHICLSLLGEDWSPSLTCATLALSILSMLSSATKKEKPKGDAAYSRSHPMGSDPKLTRFLYDDDDV